MWSTYIDYTTLWQQRTQILPLHFEMSEEIVSFDTSIVTVVYIYIYSVMKFIERIKSLFCVIDYADNA